MSFVTDFDPTRGDVIYGISPARTKYRDAFTRHHESFITKATGPDDVHFKMLAALGFHQMDEYNNYFGIPTAANAGSAKKLDQHLDDTAQKAATSGVARADPGRIAAYQSTLSTSRFSPSSVFATDRAKLDKEGYRANQFTDARGTLSKIFNTNKKLASSCQALDQSRNYLAIRRACKFGIGLVATAPEFQNALVHFVLDGLDMTEVATKATRQSTGSGMSAPKTFVSITVSELRYVYRNWSKLSAKVVLYVDLQPVAAPWITDWGTKNALASVGGTVTARKDLWDQYGADRQAKYPGALPQKTLV